MLEFKSEALEKFKEFKQEVEMQTEKNILTLGYDRDSGIKVVLEKVQETTNEIGQLDNPMAEFAFDKAHIKKGEPPVSEDTLALCKLNNIIHFPWRYDLLISSNVLLIEKDEPTTYSDLESSINSKR
ncbi:hypothetical protein Adt_03447 [Abeliophyllum distichum]|uniref:Uncharacterized protein n=1 Tax=Abeliophyllum distichum TaxID=126358 RepID=A0ABD1VYJ8_9LAMI